MTHRFHVGIIMDGNGRWAQARGLPRIKGHRAGVDALRRTVRACPDLGVDILSLYAFSTENFARPREEVSALLEMADLYLEEETDKLAREGVCLRMVGDRSLLKPDLARRVAAAEKLTEGGQRLTMNVLFAYGGIEEITAGARELASRAQRGELDPEKLDSDTLAGALWSRGQPLDLLIRTGGEQRLSNFMLWSAAYAELVFLDCHWPDFDAQCLGEAIEEFRRRQRRFGTIAASGPAAAAGER